MKRKLNITLWVLFATLTPLTLIGVIAQNSIPGNFLYPVKRSYEGTALAIASLRPETKADYTTNLATTRFKEAERLLVVKSDTQGLQSLVQQVQAAEVAVSDVKDEKAKEQLQTKLVIAIDKYQEGLSKTEQQVTPLVVEDKKAKNSAPGAFPSQAARPSQPQQALQNQQQAQNTKIPAKNNQPTQNIPYYQVPTSVPNHQNQITGTPTTITVQPTTPVSSITNPPENPVTTSLAEQQAINEQIRLAQEALAAIRDNMSKNKLKASPWPTPTPEESGTNNETNNDTTNGSETPH